MVKELHEKVWYGNSMVKFAHSESALALNRASRAVLTSDRKIAQSGQPGPA